MQSKATHHLSKQLIERVLDNLNFKHYVRDTDDDILIVFSKEDKIGRLKRMFHGG